MRETITDTLAWLFWASIALKLCGVGYWGICIVLAFTAIAYSLTGLDDVFMYQRERYEEKKCQKGNEVS